MGGHGSFSDPRIGLLINQTPDLVTPKLPALLEYQLGLRTPRRPRAASTARRPRRGERLFRNEARCARAIRAPTFTDVLSGPIRRVPFLHDPAEVGMDRAMRRAVGDGQVPDDAAARRCWQHPPYFHDGSAPDLLAVVDHYDRQFGLNLTAKQKADLVEYLKSL